MYHAALRISEICLTNTPQHIIQFNSVKCNSNSTIELHLTSFKHSTSTTTLIIHCTQKLYKQFKRYLALRGNHAGALFCHPNRKPITRLSLVNQLHNQLLELNLNPNEYNTHSFRIGKTTDMSNSGFSESQISSLGRWKSDAYKKYIKPSQIHTGID